MEMSAVFRILLWLPEKFYGVSTVTRQFWLRKYHYWCQKYHGTPKIVQSFHSSIKEVAKFSDK